MRRMPKNLRASKGFGLLFLARNLKVRMKPDIIRNVFAVSKIDSMKMVDYS